MGSYLYLYFEPQMIPRPKAITPGNDPWIFIHVAAGAFWLVSGLTQIVIHPKVHRLAHRLNGVLYVIFLLVSCVSLILINFSTGHKTPFGVTSYGLTAFSLIGLVLGLYFLCMKDYPRHSAWMIRSMIMPLAIPVYRLVASASTSYEAFFTFVYYLPFMGIITAELVIARKLDRRLPLYALPIVITICAVSFWLLFRFQLKHVGNLK